MDSMVVLYFAWTVFTLFNSEGNDAAPVECFYKNHDYPGNDFKTKGAKNLFTAKDTANECQALCAETGKCNFFTYSTSNKRCYMKTARSGDVYEEGAISGPKECLAMPEAAALFVFPYVGATDAPATGEDDPFCVAVNCSLPNAMNLCPIKCLPKDPEFCGAEDCSHSNSHTFCPIKCPSPSKEDEPFCVAVECSLPNAENLCPIKCSLPKDPKFCDALNCSHSNSHTFCPIKCPPPAEEDDNTEVKAQFNKADENNDGKLTVEEYKTVLKDSGEVGSHEQAAHGVLWSDQDGDLALNWDEFLNQITVQAKKSKEEVIADTAKGAFRAFDKNGTGKLSKGEYTELMNFLGVLEGKPRRRRGRLIDVMLSMMDQDNDGLLSVNEYIHVLS